MRTGLSDAENAARADDLSTPAAGRAGFGVRTGLGAAAVADLAALGLGNGNLFLGSVGGLLESDLHVIAQVIPALWLGRIGAPTTKQILKDSAAAEHFTKHFERIVETSPAKAARAAIKCGMTVLIVSRAFLGITQDFVGFSKFLELVLRRLVTRIFVRVVLNGHLSVSLLDFLDAGGFFDGQNLVIIALAHLQAAGDLATTTVAGRKSRSLNL